MTNERTTATHREMGERLDEATRLSQEAAATLRGIPRDLQGALERIRARQDLSRELIVMALRGDPPEAA